MISTASAQPFTKNHDLAKETLRLEMVNGSPMLWVRNLNMQEAYVDMTLSLPDPHTIKVGHMAVGVGQLYEGMVQFEAGLPPTRGPLGEGFVIGPGCVGKNTDKLFLQFESYYTGDTLDKESCIVIDSSDPIRIEFTVDKYEKSYYKVTYKGVVTEKIRSWPVNRLPYNKGFWLIPVDGYPQYNLLNLQVGNATIATPKPKQN